MELNKQTKRHLISIITFTILLYCCVEHLNVVLNVLQFLIKMIFPFLLGGTIAFILNVPMRQIERHLFTKNPKLQNFRRPVAYLLTLICIIGLIALALLVIIPELGETFKLIIAQIPPAISVLQSLISDLSDKNPAIGNALSSFHLDFASLSSEATSTIQSVASSILNSGIGIFSGLISGITNFVIAFTFSIYILFQKETLSRQLKQALYALTKEKTATRIIEIGQLSNKVFSSFFSGQCLEAVILGFLFFVVMSILNFPYAMLIGIIIAFTALIPLVGAFIGCGVGMLLIVMVNPMQAVWFLVLFLILQQIEGNLIYPHVVGGSVGLPSIWVLVAVTIGANLMGIVGILFFIPFCSVCYALFRTFVKERLKQKNISAEKWNS